jgi:transcriptional regulator with XRE-family HTH domain
VSIASNKIIRGANESETTISDMPKNTELGALIKRVREEKGITYEEISRVSGGLISKNYVHNLEKGSLDNKRMVVGSDRILGLAKGLGESPSVVFEAVIGVTAKNSTPRDETLKQMLEDYSNLSARDRDELKLLLEMLRKEIYERRAKAIGG